MHGFDVSRHFGTKPSNKIFLRGDSISLSRLIFFFWLLWTFIFAGPADRYFGMSLMVIWIGLYVPIVLLFIFWFFHRLLLSNRQMSRYPIICITLFIVYICISAIASETKLYPFLIGIRDYFKYILLLFPMSLLFKDNKTVKNVLSLSLVIIVIQLLMIFYQFIYESHMLPNDRNCGTLGFSGTGEMMLLLTYIFCTVVSLRFRGYLTRGRLVVIVSCFSLMIYMGGAYAVFLFFPFAALTMAVVFVERKWKIRRFLYVSSIVIFIVCFFNYGGMDWLRSSSNSTVQGVTYGVEVAVGLKGDLTKTAGRLYQLKQVSRSSNQSIFGHGFASNVGSFHDRILYRYSNPFFNFYSTSVISAIYEIGIIGICLYLLIVFSLGYEVYRHRKLFQARFWRGLFYSYYGCITIYIIGGFYQKEWTNTWSGFIFWFYTAIMIGHILQQSGRIIMER